MQALLDRLDLVAAMDIPGLVKVCGVDEDDVRDMMAELKSLDAIKLEGARRVHLLDKERLAAMGA